jgi:phenylpyruvate tautomerase PptA (4-oxalocrotonate tautomerase family)
MPSYTVYTATESLSAGQRAELARAITTLHSEHTGAPRSFVQTVFLPVVAGAYFIGAEPADPRCVWVYGHIRSGRPEEVRTSIAEGIAAAVQDVAQIPRQFVWVYLNELARTDMIEFGSVLPVPGQEAAWIQAMTPEVREYLRALG